MKKWMTCGAMLCVLLAAAGLAQTPSTEKGRIEVPFPFLVERTTLPPGTYLISENSSTHQLIFRNIERGSASVFVNSNDVDISRNATGDSGKIQAVFAPDDSGRQVLHRLSFPADSHANDLWHKTGIPEPH